MALPVDRRAKGGSWTVEELEGFEQILRMYLLHSWGRLEVGRSITKGYECPRLGTDNEGLYAWPWGVQRLPSDHLFLLFHDKTSFRVSPKLCYGLGGKNCILCLNALMFIWNGYVQVSLMLYSLKIIKLHNWIINFVSPLEAVPECPFQSAVLQALHRTCSKK